MCDTLYAYIKEIRMKIEITGNKLKVTREKGDPSYRRSEWGSAESRLLYHVKNKLNAQGYDLIKKRMAKDGHMVDDNQLYLRARKPTKNASHNIAIMNNCYAIYDAGEVFTKEGEVELMIVPDYFSEK